MLNPHLVDEIASAFATESCLVEKEWYVVQAVRVIASLDHGDACPIFSGGTSLSVGWGLINRFSEDIDFKVVMPGSDNPSQARTRRRNFRRRIFTGLAKADFRLIGEPRLSSSFFCAQFAYPNVFDPVAGMRPHIQIEVTFEAPVLPAVERPLRSLIAQAHQSQPEVASFLCVDPVETAADKLSALAWRTCARDRSSPKDDPTIVRHLHDLAALETLVSKAPGFASLVANATKADTHRGGGKAPENPAQRFGLMLELLESDALWAQEYDRFVHDKSFAGATQSITFDLALTAIRRLVAPLIDFRRRDNAIRRAPSRQQPLRLAQRRRYVLKARSHWNNTIRQFTAAATKTARGDQQH